MEADPPAAIVAAACTAPGCLVIDKHEPGGYITPYAVQIAECLINRELTSAKQKAA